MYGEGCWIHWWEGWGAAGQPCLGLLLEAFVYSLYVIPCPVGRSWNTAKKKTKDKPGDKEESEFSEFWIA